MNHGGGRVDVYLFGAPRLERDGEPLPLNRSKALALLAYLCVDPTPHTRDALLDLLWPLFEPSDARNNLRRELSLLKSTLELDVLLADRSTIGLDPAAVREGRIRVDVEQFESLLARVAQHNDPGNPLCPDCLEALAEAVELYTGDFLAGFGLPDSPAFDDWQFFQAERLRQAAAQTLDRLAEHYEQTGDYETGLTYAQRRAAIDPLHEPAHRALMTLYARSGQQAAALRQYDKARQLLRDELDLEPEPATQNLHEAIRSRALSPTGSDGSDRQDDVPQPVEAAPADRAATSGRRSTSGPPANLPADTTRFIGREPELTALDALIDDPAVRLITIAGVGGIGKTRLSLATARRQLERRTAAGELLYPDGVYWVPLAPLDDPEQIPVAVARAVDFSFPEEENVARQVINYLRDRRLLLLLDNFEHLLTEESAGFLVDMLAAAPEMTALTTSRTRLKVRGEHVFTLEGLDVPALEALALSPVSAPATFADVSSAVALFQESARRVDPEFVVDESNIQPVLRICRLVDGLPLGIELAAGWLEMLEPEAIAEEIERSLDFLEAEWEDIPARQSSLRAVFNTSWRWLTPDEQRTLRYLTVFRGGFDREAAEAVAGASLRVLHALVMKNWLHPVGRHRYQIHEMLRQYAEEELLAVPNAGEEARQRHAAYYADFHVGLGRQMRQNGPAIVYDVFEHDLDNIQSALVWLVEQGEITRIINEMMPVLFRYMESRYSYHLLSRQLIMAEARARELGLRRELAVLLSIRSAFFFNGYPTRFLDYDWVDAVWPERMQEAWELMPREPAETGYWSTLLAWQYGRFVDFDAGMERLRDLLSLFRERDLRWETAFALQSLGRLQPLEWLEAEAPEAQAQLHEAAQLFAELGDEREEAVTRLFMGLERWRNGDMEEALRLSLAARDQLRAIGEEMIAANVNWQLADVVFELGRTDEALAYLRAMGDALIAANRAYLAIAGMSRESYEAVRYGDLDHALERRWQCLALSKATQNEANYSWDAWELGEVYRVMGDLDKAEAWYAAARRYFQQSENDSGYSFYLRGMGDLALQRGQIAEADRYLDEGLQVARRLGHDWLHGYLLARLARAKIEQGDLSEAARLLLAGIEVISSSQNDGLALVALAAVADLYGRAGDAEPARELAGRILRHPLLWRETRREAAAVLELPQEEAAALKEPEAWDVLPLLEAQRPQLERLAV